MAKRILVAGLLLAVGGYASFAGAAPNRAVLAATSRPAAPVETSTVVPLPTGTPSLAATEEPLPPTPGPPEPTPRLPEDGGPPGGVIGGHIYIDKDGSGSFTAGDATPGGTIEIFRIYERQFDYEPEGHDLRFSAQTDESGYWERRALPDGRYRVMWDAPVRDPANLARTIPPAERIALDPITTVTRVQRIVEIRGANRVYDIDMGMPDEGPVFGGGVRLPSTGTGGDGSGAPALLLAIAGAGSLALATAVALRRRSGA